MRTLDDDVTVLAKSRALHGEGEGGPSTGLERGSENETNEAKWARYDDYLLKSLIVGFFVRHGGPLGWLFWIGKERVEGMWKGRSESLTVAKNQSCLINFNLRLISDPGKTTFTFLYVQRYMLITTECIIENILSSLY
jgi:hypothetical protein